MSFILRNLTAGTVEINDLGLSLAAYEDYDLTQDDAKDIAGSTDLPTGINANNLIILNPLDEGSPHGQLTKTQSLKCVSLANDAHYGIQAGELSQLDDVSDATPTDNYVLTYNAGTSQWEPQAAAGGSGSPTGASGATGCFPFYLANGSYDSIPISYGLFPFYRANGAYDPITMGGCS